ncbi:hypothetical protein TIFTF001_021577 [Ficus carica]|uniref:SCP domain-containing protein n=1 Tax=Ficus carica TaxID=3494 RepID=A0AA88DDR9_FICCA|nr:hypothetical protein TIFTF001_021577 [Ficus carica]
MGSKLNYLVATLGLFMGLILTTHALPPKQPYQSHQDFVDVHNAIRAKVGVGPITWNKTVAAYARNYANQQIADCKMEHSGGPYGENLAEGWGMMTGEQAVKFWASEKPHYDYASNSCVGDECGHYTQIVWRNSVHLGCARAKCHNGWMFVICSYDPPGNYEGERPY